MWVYYEWTLKHLWRIREKGTDDEVGRGRTVRIVINVLNGGL